MARILNTVLGRLVLAALAIHALLAPLLFILVIRIVERNEIDLFVNDVRAYSRFLGDMLELEVTRSTESELIDVLDSIVLSHETVYAELAGKSLSIRSSLVDEPARPYAEDFAFGDHADGTYFLSIPLNSAGDENLVLLLGFDETATAESLASARAGVFWALVAFVALSLLLATALGVLLTRPLHSLRRASQTVASGSYDEHFGVTSSLLEIRELASDLEYMRDTLVRTNQRLTAEIAEHTETANARAALERKLRHVQKLETVGTLAGGIAHEFNNVLVPIKLYTELALEELPQDSAIRADLERVLTSAARAKSLVQKILTFSRQSHQEQYSTIDLVPVVEDALALARDLFPSTIAIQAELGSEQPKITGDQTQLHQLIMNLLNNAYQAIAPKPGTIRVTLARCAINATNAPPKVDLVPGEYLALSVADSGHGLDAVAQERIFEPFYTTRTPGEGTGLGLSVAHGIASKHGGAITVESERGRGATFTVYFPVASHTGATFSGLAMKNVLYVATAGAANEHRVAVTAMGGRARAVASRAELMSLLPLEEGVDLLILDFGDGALGRRLLAEDLSLATKPHLLLIGPLPPAWEGALSRAPYARHLLPPVDARTILSAAQSMLDSAALEIKENAR